MATGDVQVEVVSPNGKAGAIFDGVDDYIKISDSNSLDVDEITLSMYVKLNSAPLTNYYLTTRLNDTNTQESFRIYIDSNLKINMIMSDDGDTSTPELTDDSLKLNKWYHLIFTYSLGTYKIYVNGIQVSTDGSGNATGTLYKGSGQITNGARYDSGDGIYKLFLNGILSDIRYYGCALTTNEALRLGTGENITRCLVSNCKLESDYKDSVDSNDGINSGTRLSIVDDSIAASVRAMRTGANDKWAMCTSDDGQQVIIINREEA